MEPARRTTSDELDADDSADTLRYRERNAFYESLAPEAKEQFLQALMDAESRGLAGEDAWKEAAVAAQLAYTPQGADERRPQDL